MRVTAKATSGEVRLYGFPPRVGAFQLSDLDMLPKHPEPQFLICDLGAAMVPPWSWLGRVDNTKHTA